MNGGKGACAEILLLCHPGITEMDVGVGETGQDHTMGPEVDPLVPTPYVLRYLDDSTVVYPDLGILQLAIDERRTH